MNFQALIKEILGSGMTQVEVAQTLSCSQAYISDLCLGKRGKSISYDLGVKVIALHKKRMRRMARAA